MNSDLKAQRLPLNVYLLKTDVFDMHAALELSTFEAKIDVLIDEGVTADLYLTHTQGIPLWLRTLVTEVGNIPSQLRASSVSGLLLATIDNRKVAITFGHAWQKMKPRLIESNFGIRCVLNLAERDSLRAIRRDRVAEDFIQAIEQIPDSDEIDRFGIDVERDLLRGVKAKVDSVKDFGSWVAGSDSFKSSVDLNKETLAKFLSRCITLWNLEDYKKDFLWVDNIAPIRDGSLEAELASSLVKSIKQDASNFVLCVPDLLGWDDFDIFSFQQKKKKQLPCADSLDLGMWINWWQGQSQEVDLAALETSHIYAYKDDGTNVQKWTVFSCVHGMLKLENEQYLIHGGHWFRINEKFVERVNKRVELIPEPTVVLPSPGIKEKEGDYNIRAAKDSNGALLYMDKKLINHGGGKSRFEVCDLFTDNGHLICVKVWGQASGSLSHLFAQARLSVQLINNDPVYRQKVHTMIAGVNPGFADIWEIICENPNDAEIVLAVMRCCPKSSLPFFAKLSLVNCIDDLRNMRFKASFISLPVKAA